MSEQHIVKLEKNSRIFCIKPEITVCDSEEFACHKSRIMCVVNEKAKPSENTYWNHLTNKLLK